MSALVLAVLYFGLMELMLIDASRALAEANRFRARTIAAALAEDGVELASAQMMTRQVAVVNTENDQGKISGKLSTRRRRSTSTTAGTASERSGSNEGT